MKKLPILFLTFLTLFFSCKTENKEVRITEKFNKNWKFSLQEEDAFSVDYNDSGWRTLNVPHDWSIEGGFDKENPAGIGGGALPGGIGWYRKYFKLAAKDSLKRIFINFDGIYMNSEVYVNGKLVGKRPNGYISFSYDITDFVTFGESQNLIAVKADNSKQPNSRWYSGCGIYRNVWLEKTEPLFVNYDGTYVTTPEISKSEASVLIGTEVKNLHESEKIFKIKTIIYDKNNKAVAENSINGKLEKNNENRFQQNLTVKNPLLWGTKEPNLYVVKTEILVDEKLVDNYETTFGIREFQFDAKEGFSLNGEKMKIKGVCLHHDLGALGSAFNYRARERQLQIMKEMGVNAVRTSHNPPEPELLELCNKMGLLVMDETFDMWARKKSEFDYALYWDEWHIKDLEAHIKRDRNHPSVFMWSIGNEILEQWDSTGITIARELADVVKKLDPTRPITSGLNDPQPKNFIYQSGALDVIGFNYHHQWFEAFPDSFPNQVFIATETNSSLHTRGHYDMPSDSIRIWPVRWDIPFEDGNEDNTCSAYDNCKTPWGSTHAETWRLIKKYDYLPGMFIWTGFDYIGEPTPYQWPSRSSYFGIVDLAGFPKDAFYFYQSEWTNKDVLHVFPHWNWKEGQKVDVWVYSNFDEVELFINGKSQGKQLKKDTEFRFVRNVEFEAGELKAVGTKSSGESREVIIKTAGKPAKIELIADRSEIKADGEDLSFVTVNILDKDGTVVPNANNLVKFELSSEKAEIVGVDNGLQTDLSSFKASEKRAFNGKCLAIIKAKEKAGVVTLKAVSEGLESAEVKINLD